MLTIGLIVMCTVGNHLPPYLMFIKALLDEQDMLQCLEYVDKDPLGLYCLDMPLRPTDTATRR